MFPTCVQGPKDVDHLPVFSQAISRALDQTEQPGPLLEPIWGVGASKQRIGLLSQCAGNTLQCFYSL